MLFTKVKFVRTTLLLLMCPFRWYYVLPKSKFSYSGQKAWTINIMRFDQFLYTLITSSMEGATKLKLMLLLRCHFRSYNTTHTIVYSITVPYLSRRALRSRACSVAFRPLVGSHLFANSSLRSQIEVISPLYKWSTSSVHCCCSCCTAASASRRRFAGSSDSSRRRDASSPARSA